jgi:hypothetical protein
MRSVYIDTGRYIDIGFGSASREDGMTFRARIWLLGTVACAVVVFSAPAAQGAFGVESFFAANCKATFENCNKAASPAEEKEKAEEEGYTQAAGHPPFGVTDFKIKSHVIQLVPFEARAPEGSVKNLRLDVAPGVSTNPEAVPKCPVTKEGFIGTELEPVPGLHAFTAPTCPGSEIGTNTVHVVIEVAFKVYENFEFKGAVYNLVQPPGLSSYFGVALNLQPLLGVPLYAHTFIEGHVEWASDYHDLFEINNITPGLIESRLVFKGNIGTGGFLSNPSSCSGPGPQTTTGLHVDTYEGESASTSYTTPIGIEGCNGLPPFELVPFAPTFALLPETKQSDQPDGIMTELVLPHDPNPANLDSSQLKTATVVLPEGMTLNPSAAQGLEACTPAQARIHSTTAGVGCPAKSNIGGVTLNVPGLPLGSLTGSLYLGGPESGLITGPPYTVYIDAESARYGISTRLRGEVVPNEATGRVTAIFPENPEQPFSDAIMHFKTGALAPIANPLVCGPAKIETSLVPYTGTPAVSPFAEFAVDSNNLGGVCPSPLPFSLGQSAEAHPTNGGANTNFTLNLARPDGQQYLSRVSTTLPAGLVGKIPAVPLCPEPLASLGTCSSTSQIGTATTTVGSGPTPVHFSGPVYLTGPTGSAPYGMTVVVNAAVGPFSLGNVVTRAGIEVNSFTARVTVASTLPTIVKGIPLRLKTLNVAITRQGFLVNPTNCGALTTNTTLTSTFGATQSIATPFQATGCSSLGFKPRFGATSNAKTSRANGAALVTHVNYPSGAQANIKSVLVTVPKQLPSRLSTLKHACPEAVFNANPNSCPSNSRVGTARVKTPVLPGQLIGPAYFVSHGGAAFPDLDLVISGDGVTVILVGNTNIKNGVTTTNFASNPDVPFTGFELNLSSGPNSALAAVGSLCAKPLIMPTTITAQNGKVIKQKTHISVSGCGVKILSHRVSGHRAILKVQAPAAGRVSGGGSKLKTVYRHPSKFQQVTLEVPLSRAGLRALAARSPLSLRVRVGFLPKARGPSSTAFATVTFR